MRLFFIILMCHSLNNDPHLILKENQFYPQSGEPNKSLLEGLDPPNNF